MAFFSNFSLLPAGLLGGCLLLGLGLLWLAWRRPRRRQRGARMLAGALAAGALWLTAFPPMRPVPAAHAEAILLTSGYSPDTLRQLRRRLGAGTHLWVYGDDVGATPAAARPLGSLLTLAEQRPAVRRLHVLGQGLAAAELPALGTIAVTLHAGPDLPGFRTAAWPQKPVLGEVLRVEGFVELPQAPAAAWVSLHAAGAPHDSVRLPAGGGAFRLRYQPKTAGRALYELRLRRPGQPPLSEPVPVEVVSPARPAVLLLAATPSFEFKFLKNHLAEAQYPVALRTTVSRGLVQTDFVNQPQLALSRLTPALLAHYAIVIADAATLSHLSGPEAQALQAAIRAGRLGLLTLAGAAPLPRAAPARADFAVLPRAAAAPQPLAWPDAPAAAQALLPAQLRPAAALRRLVTGPGRAVVAASRRAGLGFVVVSVVPETFRWVLQGQAAVYASFWNQLLRAAQPPAPAAATWRLGTRWPRPHQPLTLHLAAAAPTAVPEALPTGRALAGGPAVRLPLRQDPRLPEWYTASFWPAGAGWQQLRGPGRTSQYFYVFPAAAWAGPARQALQQAVADHRLRTAGSSKPGFDTVPEPWPAGWFFGLFLLAAGYLWLEEKL